MKNSVFNLGNASVEELTSAELSSIQGGTWKKVVQEVREVAHAVIDWFFDC